MADPRNLPLIGWREWASLPDLNVKRIKAKIDSGARSSCLHAFDIETGEEDGEEFVRFSIHPRQRSTDWVIRTQATILEYREVRSSNGIVELRPVIVTELELMGQQFEVDLTLADRSEMSFRMLIGREAIRGRFLLDADHSYYGGRPKAKVIEKFRRKKAE